jgi:hypothetical protein
MELGTWSVGQPDGSELVPAFVQLQINRNKDTFVTAETVW